MTGGTILLVNHTVPVEPFLSDELQYLVAAGHSVTLLPTQRPGGAIHPVQGVPVSLDLARTRQGRIRHAMGAGGAFFLSALRADAVPFSCGAIARLAHFCASVMVYRRRLRRHIRATGLATAPLLVYTYWFSPATYAAYMLKQEFPHLRVVSRAHGVDVFPDRHSGRYLPLRKMCGNWVDRVCPCSKAGQEALERSGVEKKRIRLSYLGVPAAERLAASSSPGELSLVSCSSMQAVKRLPQLVDGLAAYARARPGLAIRWVHLGGHGRAFSKFRQSVERTLAGITNLSFALPGQLSTDEVRAFYMINAVDALVNTSESEGLPVSMMEAMSAGIPVVGTSVGGVPELVNVDTGRLLPMRFSATEFTVALDAVQEFKSNEKRSRIAAFFASSFLQDRNYPEFLSAVIEPELNMSRRMLCRG